MKGAGGPDGNRASVARMLEIFDVAPAAEGRYGGTSDGGGRRVVDGSQLLAQAIVAASKSHPRHTVRSAHAVFARVVDDRHPVWFAVDDFHEGRTFATTTVTVGQGDRKCATVTVLLDVVQPDVAAHATPLPAVGPPAAANPYDMPMEGRELRLVGVDDPNDPDEVGSPVLDAWVRYSTVPNRPDLAKALVSHFTGHLSISTTLRAHDGLGTSIAHGTLSTAVISIGITFHEPVAWDGWLLYHHEGVQLGGGMSYVRGQIFTEEGALVGSFHQEGMIRAFSDDTGALSKPVSERL